MITYKQLRNWSLQAELIRTKSRNFLNVLLQLPKENFGRGMKIWGEIGGYYITEGSSHFQTEIWRPTWNL